MKLRRYHSGNSMMEVLITIVVTSTAVLALAYLQGVGLQYNHESFNRSQATVLAYDIIDRIRGNGTVPTSADAEDYTAAPSESDIQSCNMGTASRANDRNCWYNSLGNALPKGNGLIAVSGSDFVIQVAWYDRLTANNDQTDTQNGCEARDRIWSASLNWGPANPAPDPPACMQTQVWITRT